MRHFKRIAPCFFVIALCLILFSPRAEAAATYSGGSGTEKDPYLISRTADLVTLANEVNSGNSMAGIHFRLTRSLDMKFGLWEPIGTTKSTPFAGTFDGNRYTISNLMLTWNRASYSGLFGYNSGTIKNLYLYEIDQDLRTPPVGNPVAGLLAAENHGTISTCYIRGSMFINTLESNILYLTAGSVCGVNEGQIADCAAHTNILCNSNHNSTFADVGGICGSSTGSILRCEFSGSVDVRTPRDSSTTLSVGGIVGFMRNTSAVTRDCVASTDNLICGTGSIVYAGGIVGNMFGTVEHCCFWGTNHPDSVLAWGNILAYSGGIIGVCDDGSFGNCIVYANGITALASIAYGGSIIGYELPNSSYFGSFRYLYSMTIFADSENAVPGSIVESDSVMTSTPFTNLGFDFTNVWEHHDIRKANGVNYPTLRSTLEFFARIRLTIQSSDAITISASYQRYIPGETVTLSANVNEKYLFHHFLVDGKPIEGNTFTVTGNHVVSAEVEECYWVRYTPVTGATTPKDQLYRKGETVDITYTLHRYYDLQNIYVNDVPFTESSFTVETDTTILLDLLREVDPGYSAGIGTADDPYLITSESDFRYFAKRISEGADYGSVCFLQTRDLDLACTESNPWIPIGANPGSAQFSGSYDGNNFTISGLYVNQEDYAGLFYELRGTVTRLDLADSTFTGATAGALAGKMSRYELVRDVNVLETVTVNGSAYAGGLVGIGNDVEMKYCSNLGAVNGTEASCYAGGLIASDALSLTSCWNGGTVNGYTNTGGLIGDGTFTRITRCYNVGTVKGTFNVGGLTGRGGYISYCYNAGRLLDRGTGMFCYGFGWDYESVDNSYHLKEYHNNVEGAAVTLKELQTSSTYGDLSQFGMRIVNRAVTLNNGLPVLDVSDFLIQLNNSVINSGTRFTFDKNPKQTSHRNITIQADGVNKLVVAGLDQNSYQIDGDTLTIPVETLMQMETATHTPELVFDANIRVPITLKIQDTRPTDLTVELRTPSSSGSSNLSVAYSVYAPDALNALLVVASYDSTTGQMLYAATAPVCANGTYAEGTLTLPKQGTLLTSYLLDTTAWHCLDTQTRSLFF